MFARRLDECCEIDVSEAKSGDLLIAGRALICPGNRHMMIRRMPRGDMAVLSDSIPVNGHRPSVDVLFHSVAQEFGPQAVGILMTGMGEDGAEGLGAMKAAGAITLAQSEDSCIVGGMPRAAIQKGYVSKIVPLDTLGSYLISQFGSDRGGVEKSEKIDQKNKKEKQKEVTQRT
jgi:two-component system chemotaxis response regulator CheB